ncbi:DUF6538 domain-containing protein [Methylobacterium sp. WCS2018Hpa-22]|uniref:DUF6538 domain-containing protein n=1 Tax=Methylobacterium sp. WCS2018Hpa-22 TaxID=3073633 RepID=UPI0038620E22
MRRAEYLQCRRGRWYVRLRVPAHLVVTVGQQHLVRALDTSSEAVARERGWIALSLFWDWIGAQVEANRFAALVLMPRHLMRGAMAAYRTQIYSTFLRSHATSRLVRRPWLEPMCNTTPGGSPSS